jgi:hypothetical protein
MSAATHNKTNRRGKIYLSHKEWKKRQNITKALKQWLVGKKREDKHNSVNPPVDIENMPKEIKSNFELDPDMYTGGESK